MTNLRLVLLSAVLASSAAFTAIAPNKALRIDSALNAKKILLCFDGTGNNARDFAPDPHNDKTFTNVLRLHLLAGGDINNRINSIDGQISIYERGIGAVSDRELVRLLRQAGGDLSRQTKPMKEKLAAVYEPGDKLYMIGFSRGATSARKFATELCNDGLKLPDGSTVTDVPIEFMGCFETVSMQVKKNLFEILFTRKKERITQSEVLGEDGKVAANVKKAVHHVALDDNRQWDPLPCFPPVLMGREERTFEAWFSGEHGDVGGNFYTKGIPDCSCVAMKEWMENLGDDNSIQFIKAVDINPDCLKIDDYPEVTITQSDLTLDPDPSGPIHLNAECQVATEDFTPSYRPIMVVENDTEIEGATVKIHESVLLHMEADKKAGKKYPINPNIKEVDFVVVGALGKVLEDETQRMKDLIASDY